MKTTRAAKVQQKKVAAMVADLGDATSATMVLSGNYLDAIVRLETKLLSGNISAAFASDVRATHAAVVDLSRRSDPRK